MDCLEGMKLLDDKSVDLIVTDPPYGINYQSNRRNQKFNKIKMDDSLDWIEDFIFESYRVLKSNSAFYCFTRWDVYPTWKSTIENLEFKIKNCLVWHKLESLGGMGDLEGSYISNYEFIIFATKGRKILWKNGKKRKYGIFRNTEINSPSKLIHPNQKPVSLIIEFINDATNKGDIVLDPFMGSGTTALACIETNRNFIGFEIEKEYYEMANKRIKKVKSQWRF